MDENESFPPTDDLPKPENDGAVDHLSGTIVPSVTLSTTNGATVDLSELSGRTIVYCYPKTGRPGEDVIPDGWDEIPGAKGCTPEACGFRDHYQALLERGVSAVFGLSTQSSEYQREARDRLHLPFELLSDSALGFTTRLRLPTFELANETFLKRLTLILSDGQIEYVFYPVFPPGEHADEVVQWLDTHSLN